MRKLKYVVPVVLLFGVSVAGAEQSSSQRAASAAPITSAQSVAGAKDDQPVKLRGEIVSKQGRNDYLLRDSSGQVTVEIGSRLLNGKQLTPGTQVEIVGEVDTRIKKEPKVEARSVTVLAMSDAPSTVPDARSPSNPSTGDGAGG